MKPLDLDIQKEPPKLRGWADIDTIRSNIYDRSLSAVRNRFQNLENNTHRLEVVDLDYSDPIPNLRAERKALLDKRTLARKMSGKYRLIDKATGNVVSETGRKVIAHIPHMTRSGTFIRNGNEYAIANQQRLRSGVFTRQKKSGDYETQFNVLPGTGRGFRLQFDPKAERFKFRVGQGSIDAYPILRAAGISDEELAKTWGEELYKKNVSKLPERKYNEAIYKFASLMAKKSDGVTKENAMQMVPEILSRIGLDEMVTRRTLGNPYTQVNPEVLLAANRRLLSVMKGEESPDERDSIDFQMFLGPEDFISEHLEKDADGAARKALWKASFSNSLDKMPSGALTANIDNFFDKSQIAAMLTQVNPFETYDMLHKLTRLGRGGIANERSVDQEARGVQPSHFGFIDPLRSPESLRAGLDLRLAYRTFKGDDNQIYTEVRDPKTGKIKTASAADVVNSVVAFPGELNSKNRFVAGIKDGKMQLVDRDEVQYEIPYGEDSYSPLTSMVPLMAHAKGQRMLMGARMLSQTVSLDEPEARLVQTKDNRTGRSYDEILSESFGTSYARKPGVVKKIKNDIITIQSDDGSIEEYELYDHHPFNTKGFMHNTPTVKPGDKVGEGQILARSNYTDSSGRAAYGKNLNVAFHTMDQFTHDDAIVISESAARKLASNQILKNRLEKTDTLEAVDYNRFRSLFPGKYTKHQLEKIDPKTGMAKPGVTINPGDPLILGIGKAKPSAASSIMRQKRDMFTDASLTWDHEDPAVVVDARPVKGGFQVVTKYNSPMKVGDKLCYTPDTEVLTQDGWKLITDVTLQDTFYSLNPNTHEIEFSKALAIPSFRHSGPMYSLDTTQVSLCVTDNHNLYACPRGESKYSLIEAKDLYGTRYKMKKDGIWHGASPEVFRFPKFTQKTKSGSLIEKDGATLPISAYCKLLGMFLSEGCLFRHDKSGSFGIEISQSKESNRSELFEFLEAAGIKFNPTKTGVRIYGKSFYSYFKQFGLSYEKFISREVFSYSKEDQKILLDALIWGDGNVSNNGTLSYTTCSKRLADDISRLCLHVGYSATIKEVEQTAGHFICGKQVKTVRPYRYNVHIYRHKNCPEINHGHISSQKGQKETWIDYDGTVHCVTLEKNHILYVRRNGKTVWCGNSNFYGGKGIVSKILPDDEMIQDAQGNPIDVALTPGGLVSRVNPAQVIEANLGKVARKTGVPYVIPQFDERDLLEFSRKELEKHGLSEREDLIDPVTGKTIPGIYTGVAYLGKLHHMGEGKVSARGVGVYGSDFSPARGGEEDFQSKKQGWLDVLALVSHGATDYLKDKMIRGQRNDDFWRAYRLGHNPPMPRVYEPYERFMAYVQGSGAQISKKGTRTHLFPLTDSVVKGKKLRSADTYDFNSMEPIEGGLFDPALTGGKDGNDWSYMQLDTPIPNPIVEPQIKTLLGLTGPRFEKILSGEEELNNLRGPEAIKTALQKINLDRELELAKHDVRNKSGATRDQAVKKIRLLEMFKKYNMRPEEIMISKIPVLPPKYRPISSFDGTPLVADANYLYKEVFEANQNFNEAKDLFGEANEDVINLYKATKGLFGLGDPVSAKNVERNVRGLLRDFVGKGSPKGGAFQSKVIGGTMDTVGRSVVSPDPNLTMDEVSLPNEIAWTAFEDFVMRKMVRHGYDAVDAKRHIEDRTSAGAKYLDQVMEERPVVITRAPTLHRHNMLGMWAKRHAGNDIKVPLAPLSGMNMDFDGDTANVHVPVSDGAVRDVIERMRPSQNLVTPATMQVHMKPEQMAMLGLYRATAPADPTQPPVEFPNEAEVIKAYSRGEISHNTPVVIRS